MDRYDVILRRLGIAMFIVSSMLLCVIIYFNIMVYPGIGHFLKALVIHGDFLLLLPFIILALLNLFFIIKIDMLRYLKKGAMIGLFFAGILTVIFVILNITLSFPDIMHDRKSLWLEQVAALIIEAVLFMLGAVIGALVNWYLEKKRSRQVGAARVD